MNPFDRNKLMAYIWYAICTLGAFYYSMDSIIDYLAYEYNTLSTLPTDLELPRFSICSEMKWPLKDKQSRDTSDFIRFV